MRRALRLLLLGLLAACSKTESTKHNSIKPYDAGPCGISIREIEVTGAHKEVGTPLTWSSNPPAGGDHYPIWATWGAHAVAIPRGFWVHNLEHGGVVFSYRCASRAACPALAAQVEDVAKNVPQDPTCAAPVRARVVVVPDPELPAGIEVGASAWGISMTAKCFDAAGLRAFYADYVANAPEDTCAEGDPSLDAAVPPSDAGPDATDAADAADAMDSSG